MLENEKWDVIIDLNMSKKNLLARGNHNIVKTPEEKEQMIESATIKFGEFLDT